LNNDLWIFYPLDFSALDGGPGLEPLVSPSLPPRAAKLAGALRRPKAETGLELRSTISVLKSSMRRLAANDAGQVVETRRSTIGSGPL